MGYADRWSAAPGETVRFMVSSELERPYVVSLVRLAQPDAGVHASPFMPRPVDAPCNGVHPGRRQTIPIGSFAVAPDPPAIEMAGSFTLSAFVRPSLPVKGRQALVGSWSDDEAQGFGLELRGGVLHLLVGGQGGAIRLSVGRSMPPRWHRVGASFDAESGLASVWQEPISDHDFHAEVPALRTQVIGVGPGPSGLGFTFAAWDDGPASGPSPWNRRAFAHHFNGRIERPWVARRAMTAAEVAEIVPLAGGVSGHPDLVAAWDFSREMTGDMLVDLGPHRLCGRTLNQPARATPGVCWRGETNWMASPEEYGAVHFHEDDLSDACWTPDFEYVVPLDMPSGVYAARLACDDFHSWIVFFVRPPRGQARSDVAFLAPTATYTAYQNHRGRFHGLANERLHGRLNIVDDIDAMFIERPDMGLSTYDRHSDGSGVAYASHRRPAQNIRPDGRLWNFSIDLFIIDWLEHLGVGYDVLTDEDLHLEGEALLARYRVVITGSHPEYTSLQMTDALEGFLRTGGRLMYMGGNGFYWRIGHHPERADLIEVRRPEGVRAWDAEPGGAHLSFTGERSGLWRRNGRAPQRLVGIGFISQGFDRCTHYRRAPLPTGGRLDWIFDGVGREVLGDFGVLYGGAAGLEIDAGDPSLGTPDHAVVLARSEGHSNTYELVGEEVLVPHGATDALLSSDIRAEMLFFETPAGGAVFSTGSIAYAGSLGWNAFENEISRLTANVLRRFRDPAAFEMPAHAGSDDRWATPDETPGAPDSESTSNCRSTLDELQD